jgi:DNA polymerase III subunit delta'
VGRETAIACARLSLGDAERARELAQEEGAALRAAAERFARATVTASTSEQRPWEELLAAVRKRGDGTRAELEGRAAAEIDLYPRKERKRVETEWADRIRRVRRRVETSMLDLGLQLVGLWYSDLACLAWGAQDLVRNVDRTPELADDAGRDPARLRRAVELLEDTRQRFQLNVTEELACEALAYRLEQTLSS